MITQKHTQESLSRSYIHAIAGTAGVNIAINREFDYGVDGTFRAVVTRNNRRIESGYCLDFQLKCTKNWSHEQDNVSYSIETKTYNDIVTRQGSEISLLLILLCVPQDIDKWINVSEDSLILSHCCYYVHLNGAAVNNENSTKKILIPRSNVLCPRSLNELIAAEKQRLMNGSAQ
jgi:hypothetical protein